MDRLVRVHFAHRLADRRREAGPVTLRLDDQPTKRYRLLKRTVIVGAFASVAGEIGMVDVADYADDRGPRRPAAPHVLVERALARPVLSRQILIDDNDRRRIPQILIREVPAALEG